jgi:hypothetical protein
MVDRRNLPRPAPEVSEDGVPATSEINEELAAEPLDVRLAREVPEPGLEEIGWGADDVGADSQFLEPGAAGGLDDDEADVIGEMEAGLGDTLSAEEAAMRVVDEPPGMNYDPDPGYVDGQDIA